MRTCLMLLALLTLPASSQLHATELRDESILGELPADTAFVAVSRLHREQYDRLKEKPAIQKLFESPEVKETLSEAGEESLDRQPKRLEQFLRTLRQTELGREIRQFAIDAGSHEAFVYGDSTWVTLPRTFEYFTNLMGSRVSDDEDGASDDEKAKQVLNLLKTVPLDRFAQVNLPNLVFGCRVEDQARAERLFAKLREEIERQLEREENEIPASYKETYSVETVGDTEYLTVKIPGSWIPFHLIDRSEMSPAQEELLEYFLDGIRKRSLVLALGVRGNNVLLSIGGGLQHLKMPAESKRLIDHPKLARLREQQGEPVVSVCYLSEEFAQVAWDKEFDLQPYKNYAREVRKNAADAEGIAKVVSEQIAKDVVEFGEDLRPFHHRPGACLGFRIMTETGYSGFRYDWSEHPERNGSEPLTILQHVGKNPVLVIAGRKTYRPEVYAFRSKWLARGGWYVNKAVAAIYQQGSSERLIYSMVRDQLRPHLREFDRITREEFVPAFKDGQSAFVIRIRNLKDHPHEHLDERFQLYPYLPQVGIAWGVSDREKLLAACDGYRKTVNQILLKANAVSNSEEEPVLIPRPDEETMGANRIYSYDWKKLREQTADKEAGEEAVPVLPVGAVGEKIGLLASDRQLAETMLGTSETKLKLPPRTADAPLARFVYFDAEQLWPILGDLQERELKRKLEAKEITQKEVEAARDLFEVLELIKGYSSATTKEVEVWVTHSRIVIE